MPSLPLSLLLRFSFSPINHCQIDWTKCIFRCTNRIFGLDVGRSSIARVWKNGERWVWCSSDVHSFLSLPRYIFVILVTFWATRARNRPRIRIPWILPQWNWRFRFPPINLRFSDRDILSRPISSSLSSFSWFDPRTADSEYIIVISVLCRMGEARGGEKEREGK